MEPSSKLQHIKRRSASSSKKGKFYAVARGHKTGIFTSWDVCKEQVNGFAGAKYKSFPTKSEAEQFLTDNSGDSPATPPAPVNKKKRKRYSSPLKEDIQEDSENSFEIIDTNNADEEKSSAISFPSTPWSVAQFFKDNNTEIQKLIILDKEWILQRLATKQC
eukprot:TRINITY_DN22517_c0_g1_i1.p1 TRINITY_DN22517_c0_g1~~TRINITY_DN22517_c0_g1_i1.p1  ORF type:complete len:162 (-),score=44.23 TRINITY_DN22517_c0_g1_i1:165-650(-)